MPKPGSEGHGKSGHLSDRLRRKATRRYFTFTFSYNIFRIHNRDNVTHLGGTENLIFYMTHYCMFNSINLAPGVVFDLLADTLCLLHRRRNFSAATTLSLTNGASLVGVDSKSLIVISFI